MKALIPVSRDDLQIGDKVIYASPFEDEMHQGTVSSKRVEDQLHIRVKFNSPNGEMCSIKNIYKEQKTFTQT